MRNDRDQTWDKNGSLVSDVAVQRNDDDDQGEAFIRSRLPAAMVKAKAILADPNNAAHNPTTAEQRLQWALSVLDLARRFK